MAKKKSKKNQKQVEIASPPAPPAEEPVPAVSEAPSLTEDTPATESTSEDQPTVEIPAAAATSEDQPSSPAPKIDEATLAKAPAEEPTSEPKQGSEGIQATTNDTEQSPATQDSDVAEAAPVLESKEVTVPKEEEITQSIEKSEVESLEEHTKEPTPEIVEEHTKDSAPEVAEVLPEAPDSLAEPIEATESQDLPESVQTSDISPQEEPQHVVDASVQDEPMTAAAPEAQIEPTKEAEVDLPVAPEAPEVPEVESALAASDLLPTKGADSEQEDSALSEHVEHEPDVSDSLPPPAPEVPSTQPEPLATESIVEPSPVTTKKETPKQRRTREAEERKLREEQERLEQETLEAKELEQQKVELEQREQEAEKEREEKEREHKEREEQERLDQEARDAADAQKAAEAKEEEHRQELERLEQERLQQVKLEQEKLEQLRIEQEAKEAAHAAEQALKEAEAKEEEQRKELEQLERQKAEQEQVHREKLEQERLEQEARNAAEVAERTRKEAEAAEAARIAIEQTLREPPPPAVEEVETGLHQDSPAPESTADTALEKKSVHEPKATRVLSPEPISAEPEPVRAPTPPYEHAPEPPVASTIHDRRSTTASLRQQSSSPRSVASHGPKQRAREGEPPIVHAPRPQAVTQIIEDNRPPAPSPPVGRVRPRHTSAFDSEDDSDSALIQTRRPFRGGESRDTSLGSTYPPQPTHRFASRVPVEPAYSNPPPPPPPGYHPRYYAPPAPPHYQNHGYGMSQQGYPNSNPYGPSSHSSSSPYQESWNQYPPGYPPYGSPPQRQDSSGSRDYPIGRHAIENGSALDDESGDVFSRIAQAIPDLHVLLARYKETHGQLSVREELLRRASAEQEEKLRAKDDENEDLKEKIRNLENKHSTEASRLRFQIGNLEEQVKELREQIVETEKYKKEAEETKSALDAAMKSWEAKYKELEEAHVVLERTAAEEKAKAWRDFDEWKSTATTKHDAEKIALAIQFDKKLKEADVLSENRRQENAAAFVKEKDELRSEHQRQQREREASFDRVRNELETKLGSAQKDREEALKHERESREFWVAERETLLKAHQEDHASLQKGWEEQRDLLEAQYKNTKDESDKAWIDLHADASRRADEEKAKVEQLTKEREELLKKYNELKEESQKEKEIIKSVATNLDSEKARLEKLMDCYGDIAEIKSKGDTYYLVSFSQLQKQIIDLASTHFIHLPVRPPSEDLAQVPSNLPSFLGDTLASRQIRAAYVAHTVSKLITYRVFGPFLFSLGRRYDKADSLFLSMSNHIRDKSTRKEAIWRQQTLLAAFTSSGAKQRINTAAGTVVEEIVNAVKHFADPKEEEGIKIAVKRIVKLAAETWRFARLEREMITAIMPALHDEEHQFTGPEYWPAYKSEGTIIASLAGTSPPSDIQPQLLLRLFPVIYRESKHENFHGNGEKRDEGCIFHHGLALYDDAESVVQRAEELKSAGLPPFTTASSSTADGSGKFPPPAVPPPRDPPPPPPAPPRTAPETAETASINPRSPSLSPTEKSERASIRLSTPPPPPSSIQTLEEPTPSKPGTAYKRPPPGPIEFVAPRDLVGHPLPVESLAASEPSSPTKRSDAQSTPAEPVPEVDDAPVEPASTPAPPPAEPSLPPPPPPGPAAVPEAEPLAELPHPTPTESAILPASYSTSTIQENGSRDLPTPPLSRSGTPTRPMSPLFEAIDEIDALQSHRSSRNPSVSLSRRRSTHTRHSNDRTVEDELPEIIPRPETVRRTSGYALSTRTSKTTESDRTERSERSEKSNRTERSDHTEKSHRTERSERVAKSERSDRTDRSEKPERDPKSRYMCESRSAAVKALYPNSPLAGQSATTSSKNSVKSEKKDRDSTRDSKELKRQKSTADNGTWDTNSQSRTSEETNSQSSTK